MLARFDRFSQPPPTLGEIAAIANCDDWAKIEAQPIIGDAGIDPDEIILLEGHLADETNRRSRVG